MSCPPLPQIATRVEHSPPPPHLPKRFLSRRVDHLISINLNTDWKPLRTELERQAFLTGLLDRAVSENCSGASSGAVSVAVTASEATAGAGGASDAEGGGGAAGCLLQEDAAPEEAAEVAEASAARVGDGRGNRGSYGHDRVGGVASVSGSGVASEAARPASTRAAPASSSGDDQLRRELIASLKYVSLQRSLLAIFDPGLTANAISKMKKGEVVESLMAASRGSEAQLRVQAGLLLDAANQEINGKAKEATMNGKPMRSRPAGEGPRQQPTRPRPSGERRDRKNGGNGWLDGDVGSAAGAD